MPRQYEAIRDSLVKSGKDYDQAQTIAAKIYNSRHPSNPMSPSHPEGKRRLRPHPSVTSGRRHSGR